MRLPTTVLALLAGAMTLTSALPAAEADPLPIEAREAEAEAVNNLVPRQTNCGVVGTRCGNDSFFTCGCDFQSIVSCQFSFGGNERLDWSEVKVG